MFQKPVIKNGKTKLGMTNKRLFGIKAKVVGLSKEMSRTFFRAFGRLQSRNQAKNEVLL